MAIKATISVAGIKRVSEKRYGIRLTDDEAEKVQRKVIETIIDTLGNILKAIKDERNPEQKRA